jgi:hypothetical protein
LTERLDLINRPVALTERLDLIDRPVTVVTTRMHIEKEKQRGILRDVGLMVFNATFNNISVISWWSVLLVEETAGPGENH